jgi:NAD(P)-dependent dehydrogenase (short-subunit alcohol dehydrogenase family)
VARLDGKVALVTGAAGAFGTAILARLREEGARLIATDISPHDIEAADDLLPVAHDVREEGDWHRVVEAGIDHFGRLDLIANNAGIAQTEGPQDPEHVSLDQWRSIHAVNVEGLLLGCQAGIRALRNEGGVIVNISSLAALNPSPKMAAYGASKAAVRHLTRTVAAYCAEQGYPIRCNSVHPGWFPTELVRAARTPEELAAQERAIPLGRFGEPSEVAAAVAFLCSDDAAYMTGSKLIVDGGISMR